MDDVGRDWVKSLARIDVCGDVCGDVGDPRLIHISLNIIVQVGILPNLSKFLNN